MPNCKEHAKVGAIVGGGANLVWQLSKIVDSDNPPTGFWETLERVNFFEIALFSLIGAGCACLPDLIEPATSPNHRAFFHSLATAGVVTYGAFGEHTETMSPEGRHAVRVAALSYLSHLLLDGQTPKSLPILGLPTLLS